MLLPASLHSLAQRLWLESTHKVDVELQGSVGKALVELGVECEADWRTNDGLVPVDIMVFLDHGRQIGIQVDGRGRYTRSEPHSLLERARLHKRMLRHRCPNFISLSFFEWGLLQSEKERNDRLRALLGLVIKG